MPAECSPPEKVFWVYVSLWIANFFSPLLYSGVTTILPSVASDFNTSAATISLIVMLFAYSQGYFGAIGGRLSDLFVLLHHLLHHPYRTCLFPQLFRFKHFPVIPRHRNSSSHQHEHRHRRQYHPFI